MNWRIVIITECFLAICPIVSRGQDAETRTQAILDEHKDADPTNSSRSLTSKSRSSEPATSVVPLPRVSSPETKKQIAALEIKKARYLKKIDEANQKRAGEVGIMALDGSSTKQDPNREWEKTDAGQALRRLKAEAAKAEKAQKN